MGYFSFLKAKKNIPKRIVVNSVMSNMFTLIGSDNIQYINNGYKKNLNIYAVVNWIIKKASMIQWQLYEIDKQGKKIQVYKHAVLDLLNRPNPVQGSPEFIENLLGFKLLTGESFITKIPAITGENKGMPLELWVIPPPIMSVNFDPYGIPSKYTIETGTTEYDIEKEDVLYLKYFNPTKDNFRGMSPIEAGCYAVTQNNDAYEANMKLLQNLGAQGVLTVVDEQTELTQPQAEELEKKYYEKYGGVKGYGRILVSGTKMSWVQIGLKATDLALIESIKMGLRDICNLYNLSSQLFNDPDNKTYSNMKEARKSGITDVVIPELSLITGEFNRWLIPYYEIKENKKYLLDFDRTVYPELQEDMEKLGLWLIREWGLTPNQRLEKLGFPANDSPLMDEIYIPASLFPLGASDDLEKHYKIHYNK